MEFNPVRKFVLLTLTAANFAISFSAFATETPKAPAAKHSLMIDGIQINVVMQAPHLMVTPLQVFGVFMYEKKNDGFGGADLEMDEGFKGEIQSLRKADHVGHLAEALLLTPPQGGIVVPQKVLVMGLGNIKKFKPEDMQQVGVADVREVCALGLSEFTHASDVQDGGLAKFNAGLIAEHVLIGMIREIRLNKDLSAKGLAAPCAIQKINYLAGPKFLADTIAHLDSAAKTLAASAL